MSNFWHVLKYPPSGGLAERYSVDAGTPAEAPWEPMSDEEFAAWVLSQNYAETPPPLTAPAFVRNAQLRQWLLERSAPGAPAGFTLFDAVEAKLGDPAQWPDELTRRKAYQRWEYEPNVDRDDPLVQALATDLGMDSAALDAAFIQISSIP
jgi:hypothetical protein